MPLKDRLRKAIRRDSSFSGSSFSPSESNSRVGTATNTPAHSGSATPLPSRSQRNSTALPPPPSPPTITLTKTATSSSRLSLTKSLTWSRDKRTKEEKVLEKQRKRLEYWEEKDRLEWSTPEDGWRRTGKKRSKQHQDLLRAFEFDCGNGEGRRSRRSIGSWVSGVSPGCSRVGSVDGRKRSSTVAVGAGGSALSRQVSNEDE